MRTRCKNENNNLYYPSFRTKYVYRRRGKALYSDWSILWWKTAVLLEGKIVDLLLVTHEHYDHISGVNKFKELYGCKLLSNSKCDNNLQRPAKISPNILRPIMNFRPTCKSRILLLTAIIHAAQMSFLMTALPLDGSIILCLSRWFPGTAKAVISSS